MGHEVVRQIVRIIPEVIVVMTSVTLVVFVWSVARAITIRHYLKHHMDVLVSQDIKEKERYIEMLEDENGKMLSELKRLRITMKIMRNALIIKDVD